MSTPIEDHALLSDCQGAALVTRDGSVDWWCAPRFDSPSVFGRLLDDDAGHFLVRPAGDSESSRAYLDGTMVLETTHRTSSGVLVVTDALALDPGSRGHEIGHEVPHALVRALHVPEGEVRVRIEYVPRPEYGLVVPRLQGGDGGLEALGGPDRLLLVGLPDSLEPGTSRLEGEWVLKEGERLTLVLSHRRALLEAVPAPLDAQEALEETVAAWRSWSELHSVDVSEYRDEVARSALVLQALTFAPSGALVASPTTSLPEIPGGTSNWDFRYSWLRDAAFTVGAMTVACCSDEAVRYFEWMMRAAVSCRHSPFIQIMFGVEGERLLTEHELEHLDGWNGARPVRIGNGAWAQTQLDVLGEVLEAGFLLRDELAPFDSFTASFVAELVDRAAAQWREPDSGIWEGREGERHYLPSKLGCWVALDRGVQLADRIGDGANPEKWKAARDEVREAILTEGWHEGAAAYTGAFGSDHLDAGVLLMPLVGFLPARDPRMWQTIEAVERELGEGGLIWRFTGGGDEGAFLPCSFWLADCLARGGELDRARSVFSATAGRANELGLLAEQADGDSRALLGNFPLAFSHVGLINAARTISAAARGELQESVAASG